VILNALDKVEEESEILEIQVVKKTKTPVINQCLTFNIEFRAPMYLHEFPFDSQRLPVRFISNNYTKNMMQWNPLQTELSELMSLDVKLPEFKLKRVVFEDGEFLAGYLNRYAEENKEASPFHEMTLVLEVERRPEYYITRIMSVIIFVLSMAGGVFFVDPEALNDRFNLTLTLFLTAVAFHFVVSSELPKIAYATRLDKFIAFMYVLLFLTAIENVVASRLTRTLSASQVEDTLDLAAIIAFYSILFLGSMWFLWPYIDKKLFQPEDGPVTVMRTTVTNSGRAPTG